MLKVMKQGAAVLLALALILTMIPVLNSGSWSHAGGGTDINGIITGVNSDNTVDAGSTISVSMTSLDGKYGGNFSTLYAQKKVGVCWIIDGESTEGVLKDGQFSYKVKNSDAGKMLEFMTYSVGNEDSGYNNDTTEYLILGNAITDVSFDSKGVITVTGMITKSATLYADNGNGKIIHLKSLSKGSFSVTEDVSDPDYYPRGYYSIYAKTSGGEILAAYDKAAPFAIYEKPTIKRNGNFFTTGSNFICFSPYFTVPRDSHTGEYIIGKIYFQLYDTKTKKWGGVYGPYDSYEKLKTKYFDTNVKIKANHTYKIRVFYVKDTTYGGKSYPFFGPFSNEITLKTGKGTKPAVKSVKITKAKVKKVKLIQHAHWDISGKWIPYKESYTYSTTYKVTVKLKKKPGTKGLIIGNKKVKGNKKTYSATFTDSGKLKGKKITVKCCTYNDAAIGAYSPVYTKKKVKVN